MAENLSGAKKAGPGKVEKTVKSEDKPSLLQQLTNSLPLDGLSKDEELQIVGHGDGRGKIAGLTAVELLKELMDKGLNADKHHGPINLVSCLSGTPYGPGNYFADTFCFWLRHNGFKNQVIGYMGNVHVTPNKDFELVPPEKLDEYDRSIEERTRLLSELTLKTLELRIETTALKALMKRNPNDPGIANSQNSIQRINDLIDFIRTTINMLTAGINEMFVKVDDNLRRIAIPRIITWDEEGIKRRHIDGIVNKQISAQRMENERRAAFMRKLASMDPNWQGEKLASWNQHLETHTNTPSYIS